MTTAAPTVPRITDERLADLAVRIRPVTLVDGTPHWIEPVDPRKVAFTWAPKPTGLAAVTAFATIRTLHAFGGAVFFKPSVAEVLAQIPDGYLPQAVAFSTDISDLIREAVDPTGTFHVATTTLYRAA